MLFCLLFPQQAYSVPYAFKWAYGSGRCIQVDAKLSLGRGRDAIEQSGCQAAHSKGACTGLPEDLRPSELTHIMAHFGTVLEFTFPLLLLFGDGANVTLVGLTMMVLFHAYITSHCPVAVPLEWNFVMVFGGVFLFRDGMPAIAPLLHTPTVSIVLIVCVVVVPLIGHLAPHRISFLLAMRYCGQLAIFCLALQRRHSRPHLSSLQHCGRAPENNSRGCMTKRSSRVQCNLSAHSGRSICRDVSYMTRCRWHIVE